MCLEKGFPTIWKGNTRDRGIQRALARIRGYVGGAVWAGDLVYEFLDQASLRTPWLGWFLPSPAAGLQGSLRTHGKGGWMGEGRMVS